MRTLLALSLLAAISLGTAPALSDHLCISSRCALAHFAAGMPVYNAGSIVRADCCQPAPAGWGWYLRQKYRHDRSAPLVIVDEPDAVTLVRDR